VTRERKWSVSIVSLVGAIPALLLGITLGYPSNALLDLTGEATELQPEYFFSDLMISLFVSLAPLGAIFGGPIGGWIADRWGRKFGMMFCGVPYLIGYLALSYAHFASTVSVFYVLLLVGRFFTGFGMGWTAATCPVSFAELCGTVGLGTTNYIIIIHKLILSICGERTYRCIKYSCDCL
jgi:MFS family permease